MARHATIGETEVLAVIREEQCSPAISLNMNSLPKHTVPVVIQQGCFCNEEEVKKTEVLEDRNEEYQKKLETEISSLKERFDYILRNEQIRASHMLSEAHRDRQEKIAALQTQLECKNLAALMYVLASERRKSKLEKLRIIEEYTNYINALKTLLSEGQGLILNLSRGYKTAARVDNEWREKMKKVVEQFQNFVHNFAGGEVACNQYFFDLPALLKTDTPIEVNPEEDPCETEEIPIEEPEENKTWWERLQSECRPFVVFGDMGEFQPPQRRAVLKVVKGAKVAPKKWKEYVFNEMFLQADCKHLDSIKDAYPQALPPPPQWHCDSEYLHHKKESEDYERAAAQSVDIRNMGSILKMITASSAAHETVTKATLLGARDSMEIASSTKILRGHKESHVDPNKDVLDIKKRRASKFENYEEESDSGSKTKIASKGETAKVGETSKIEETSKVEEEEVDISLGLGSIHNDSLQMIAGHVPDQDAKINYEKVCPMEKCQRMQVNSFIRSLPPYMRASPFTHFEQNYDNYEPCTPEQLKILIQRIDAKKSKEKPDHDAVEEDVLEEWTPVTDGVAVQTSVDSLMDGPPCTCRVPSPTPASSTGMVFNMSDLIPVKQMMDHVTHTCLYDDNNIELNRFKVVGQDSTHRMDARKDFKKTRLNDIRRILEKHPSLCEMFQANTRC